MPIRPCQTERPNFRRNIPLQLSVVYVLLQQGSTALVRADGVIPVAHPCPFAFQHGSLALTAKFCLAVEKGKKQLAGVGCLYRGCTR